MAAPHPQVAPAQLRRNARRAARLMRALGNESRLMVLCALTGGERTVGELNEEVALSQSALSQHLAKLRAAGIVRARRDGVTMRYSLADPDAAHLVGALRDLYRGSCR
jgi:ArsR family transcriptional regulator